MQSHPDTGVGKQGRKREATKEKRNDSEIGEARKDMESWLILGGESAPGRNFNDEMDPSNWDLGYTA